MSLLFDIALTHLKARTRQSLVSVLGVAMGVGFFVAVAALMEGSQRDFINKLVDKNPHIVVKDEYREPPLQPAERLNPGAAVELRGLKPEAELRGIRNVKAKAASLADIDGATVAIALRGPAVARYGGKDVSVSLIGIEPEKERRVSRIEADMRVGTLDSLYGTANGIILGAGVANELGAEPGSTLSVSSSAGTLLKMKVVGIFKIGVVAIDNAWAYALLKKVQILQDRPNVANEIRIRLADVNRAEAVAREIESRLGYKTESWEEQNRNVLEIFVIRNIIMYSVVGAILLVASFGIFNIVSTIIYEKARDIAILKSLGFYESDIRIVFLFEGLALGIAGSAAGFGLGYGLCELLASIRFELKGFTESQGFVLYRGPFYYALAGAVAVLSTGIAAYLPARRAARLDPVDIVRGAA